MNRRDGILLLAVAVLTLSWAHGADAQTKPSGELVWALHVSISPSWFDPGENGGLMLVRGDRMHESQKRFG